jgi:VHL beta domain
MNGRGLTAWTGKTSGILPLECRGIGGHLGYEPGMSPKQSVYGKLGIPSTIGVTVTLLALVLSIAPYMADKDFGFLRVPDFSEATKHALRLLGPISLAASLLLFFPIFEPRTGSPRSAATDTPVDVLFRNSSKRYINVIWLKFDGKEDPDHSYTVAPGADQSVATYVAHSWNVSDANTGEALRSVVAREGMGPVVIR